jgi:hypothetical protein
MHHEIEVRWLPGPLQADVHPGHADVWWIDIATPPGKPSAAGYRQSSATPGDRRAVAHGAMRDILTRYLQIPATSLHIAKRAGGKPYLASHGNGLAFNLSHSRGVALFAVTQGAEIGIDIEVGREIANLQRLARRALPAADFLQLQSLPADRRQAAFLRGWTLMEARQKAVGRGIFAPHADPARLGCFSFEPAPGTIAALAVSPRTPDMVLRFFNYSPA